MFGHATLRQQLCDRMKYPVGQFWARDTCLKKVGGNTAARKHRSGNTQGPFSEAAVDASVDASHGNDLTIKMSLFFIYHPMSPSPST